MRAAVEGLVHFLAGHPAEARILIVESSGLTPKLSKVRRTIIASHCRSVERALSSLPRPLPATDLKVVASCWVGAVHESICQWLETPAEQRISAEILAREISRFNLQGIRVSGRLT
jgi:hypothetical protein